MHELLDPAQNPVTYALPFFVLTILVELAALRWLDHDDKRTGYAVRDTGTSLLMGAGSLVFTLVLKVGSFVVYGTFQPERQRPRYGLTTPKDAHNVIALQCGDYADL